MTPRPTLKDIARVAGVHFTTVSMALRGHHQIPPGTRDRILKVAAELGYQRNTYLSALSLQRNSQTGRYARPKIAMICNRAPEADFWRRPHYRSYAKAVERHAESLGYDFELLFLDAGHHDSTSLARYLNARGIRGVILGSLEPTRAVPALDWSQFCVVKIDSQYLELGVPFISHAHFDGVRLAYQQLRQLGYRRIGLAMSSHDDQATGGLHGSALLIEQSRIPKEERLPILLFPEGATEREAVPALDHWYREHRPDAVMATWVNIRRMVASLGLRCPEQVACVGLYLPLVLPKLAGILVNTDAIGERVCTQLDSLLQTDQRGSTACQSATYVHGAWADGSSAPPKQ